MTNELPRDEPEEEQDDEVVGRAFRWSLSLFAALAAVAVGIWWFTREGAPPPPKPTDSGPAPLAVRADATPPQVTFRDVTLEAGIDFVHENGARGDKLLPETMGGGSAFLDYDGDGDVDLLLVNSTCWPGDDGGGEATSALYANDGVGRFTNVTEAAGLALRLYGMGAAVGDYDCDGDPDVYLTAVGPNRLLRNDGGRFTEVHAGVAGEPEDWSTCAVFFDADGDQDLDLFVGNYVRWSRELDLEVDYQLTGIGRAYGPPMNFEGVFPRLYRNDGAAGFVEVSDSSGLQVKNPATGRPVGKALGVLAFDVDGDLDQDLVIANDTVQNHVFLNNGDGTFQERATELGLAFDSNGRATGAMGIDAADYRGDGSLGIAIGNFANEMSSLYLAREAEGFFIDVAMADGLGAPSRRVLSFGLFFFDYDLDGRLDLLQANGHLEQDIAIVQPSQSYTQPPQLFWNAGAGAKRRFIEVDASQCGDLGRAIVGRGANYADIDGDGDLDILLTQTGARPVLLRNDQALGNHWLRLRVRGDTCNPDAVGARVELTAAGQHQTRIVSPTRSYLTQIEPAVTFGLGRAEAADSVRVLWPDGHERRFEGLAVDRLHELTRE